MEPSYTFDPLRSKLGKLCAKGHDWNGTGKTLRRKRGKCVQCQKEFMVSWYAKNREIEIEKAKERQRKKKEQDPDGFRKRKAEYIKQRRQLLGRESRSKYAHLFLAWSAYGLDQKTNKQALALVQDGVLTTDQVTKQAVADWTEADQKLKTLLTPSWKRLPSVTQLVQQEQVRYWKENPEELRKAKAKAKRDQWKIKYMIDKNLRLYTRQKSKRRKAMLRESMALQVVPKDLRKRFAEFGDLCAYCGSQDDLHMDHVVPLSKGGPHSIGNIVPACKACNFSKTDHEVEGWYRAQPFFSETRWRKICKVLGWNRSTVGQLAFL